MSEDKRVKDLADAYAVLEGLNKALEAGQDADTIARSMVIVSAEISRLEGLNGN